jgi:hypothetical protein
MTEVNSEHLQQSNDKPRIPAGSSASGELLSIGPNNDKPKSETLALFSSSMSMFEDLMSL